MNYPIMFNKNIFIINLYLFQHWNIFTMHLLQGQSAAGFTGKWLLFPFTFVYVNVNRAFYIYINFILLIYLWLQEYIHRVGRTARGEGGKGHALLILRPEELGFLRYLKQAKVPLNEFDFSWNKISDIQSQVCWKQVFYILYLKTLHSYINLIIFLIIFDCSSLKNLLVKTTFSTCQQKRHLKPMFGHMIHITSNRSSILKH